MSDDALENMLEYFEKVDEPVLIAFFGDHQPHLPDYFYKNIMGELPDELSQKDAMKRYQVPFMIWANYGIKSSQDRQDLHQLSFHTDDGNGRAGADGFSEVSVRYVSGHTIHQCQMDFMTDREIFTDGMIWMRRTKSCRSGSGNTALSSTIICLMKRIGRTIIFNGAALLNNERIKESMKKPYIKVFSYGQICACGPKFAGLRKKRGIIWEKREM